MGRKLSFLEFWRSKEERGARLERADQLKLLPSQLKRLHGDSAVRAALQNVRVASLLPPVGTEVFRRFTAAPLEGIQERDAAESAERETRTKNKEEVNKDHSKPARDLEAGKPLPFFYGDPPRGHLFTPLEELDPYYQSQKTFIVLGKGNIIQRFNAEPALHIISTTARTVAIKLLSHHSFILLTILINCFFMMLQSSHHASAPLWAEVGEIVFTVIYTLELMVKVVSRGFCMGRFTFLRDPWNWLDIVVVILPYLGMFIDMYKFLVLARISQVLKIIPLVPGLKMAFHDFAKSLWRLAGVFALTVFVLSILSAIGLQLFMGTLRHKCIKLPKSMYGNESFLIDDYSDNNTEIFNYVQHMLDPVNHHFREGHRDPLLCGNDSDAGGCPVGFTCVRAGQSPNYGYTSYDTFGWSLLSSFRLMTQDFWDNLMLLTLRANGKASMKAFVLVFFPGCFLLVSLIVSKFAMVIGEQVEARVAEADQKHEEFVQIVEAVKKREEEEAASRAALSEAEKGENETDHAASEGQQQQRQSSCPKCCLFLADLFLKWNCCGCWRWLKQRLYSVVTNPFFDLCIVICLIINIVFMATEQYPMTPQLESHISQASLVFTLIFTVEMLVKMVAMDPYNYFQVSWNVFESVIVALALVELVLADIEGVSMVRSQRLLRIFRLARWWPQFRLLLKIAWASVRALRNPTLLLVIVSFIFTVVGWHLFHNDYKDCVCRISEDCELPRWHMVDFFHTFFLVIRNLCGQWIETLWDCMEVSGKPLCLTFFMTLVIIGDLLILNLFLILLLSPLNGDSLLTVTEEKNNNMHGAIRQIKGAICGSWSRMRGQVGNKSHHTAESQGDNSKDYMALTVVPEDEPASKQMELKMPEDQRTKHEVQPERDGDEHQGDKPEDCCCQWCCCPFHGVDTSKGAGKTWANFRRACFLVAQHRCFDIFIIVIIMLSTAAMMFEDIYLHEQQVLKTAVDIVDQVCTCLFLLELLLKWIGFGLKKYFTDPWCWLDFLILDVFLVSLMADKLGFSVLGTFQFLRTLRALGPLRLLSRFQGLRLVVQVLVKAVPTMFAGLLVIMTTWLFFSILGTQLFAGSFYHCFNETSEEYFHAEDIANKSDCYYLIDANYLEVRWKNVKLNYDNVMNGYVSLLHLALSGDWMDVLYSAVDSTQVEQQPVYENNLYMYLYFIIFAISCFYSLSFFLRFIATSLLKDKIRNHIFMTEDQALFSLAMRRLFPKKTHKTVPRPQNQCQAWVFDLVTNPCYEFVMGVVICLNMVCLMVETYNQSLETDRILYWLHLSFIIVFFVEFVVKVIALRKHYFHDGWNIIDIVVLIITITGLFFTDVLDKYFISPFVFPFLRLARLCRLLYVIPPARGTRKLLLGFVMSLPALFNIVSVLLLLNVTFSLFGMFNFSHVREETGLDEMYNFKTFGNSMICMFMVCVTGGWGGLLYPIMNTPPDCDPHQENPGLAVVGDCGRPTLGVIFFSTYVTLTFLLAICLYITVILGTYNYEGPGSLSDKDLQKFHDTWMKYDPDASQFIPYSKLSEFYDSLQDPLRIPKPNAVKLTHMDLPLCTGDKVHCVDVFLSLVKQVSGDAREMNFLKVRVEKMFRTNSSQVPYIPISSTLRRKREEEAAKVIQRAYRKGLQRHGDVDDGI